MWILEYLNAYKTFSIFTDHYHLVYIYEPIWKQPGIGLHSERKLMRWTLKLDGFRFIIEEVPGERNFWVDMLTNWTFQPSKKVALRLKPQLKYLFLAPVSPETNYKFDWPTEKEIIDVQSRSK